MSAGLHVTRLGRSGPPLVFLHGLFGQGRNWTGIAKGLSDAARCLLVDLPDHGRSGWSAAFSYPAAAAQVAAVVEEVGEPATLVGHSMGGKVAMTLALSRPELSTRLCVVDIAPDRSAEVSGFSTYVDALRSLDLSTLADREDADRRLADRVADAGVRGFLLQNLRRDLHGSPPWRWLVNLDLLGASLDAISDWPRIDAVPYPHPVLWVAGERSPYIRPEHAPAMRALFPHTRLVTVKNAGHWVHADQPAVMTSLLRSFAGLAR